MKTLLAALLMTLSFAAAAQDEMPAVGSSAPKVPAPSDRQPQMGITVQIEKESPIGLYITPWRNATAQKDIDRPARLLQEQMLPIDEDVFERQVEYYHSLSDALKARGQVSPVP
jgi:hypothetical protein